MENLETITQFIAYLENSVDELEPEVKELIAESLEDRLNSINDNEDRVKVSNGYAYILVSLCFGKFCHAQRLKENN